MEPGDKYWQSWEKLIEASSNLQGLFPHAVLVGGSAAAVHAQHRFSFDADHVLSDLLAAPRPHDLDGIDVSLYKGLSQPLNSWDYIKSICEKLSVELGEEMSEDR
jgi:hypothetical protein